MNDQIPHPMHQDAPLGASTVKSRQVRSRSRGWRLARDLIVIVLIALCASFVVKTFLVRSFYIPSGSMEQTLQINDRILVDEFTPRFSGYSRGDIVVFSDPGGWLGPTTPKTTSALTAGVDWLLSLVGLTAPDSDEHLIKRIIGLPGDHVVCCDAVGHIEVNGTPIDEKSYINVPAGAPDSSSSFDVTVPQDSLWVMGDNRNNSQDSRAHQQQPGHGFVPIDDVVGRAFLITWPFSRFGLLDQHAAVFQGVPKAP